jgi:phenolic acid decarboxylase
VIILLTSILGARLSRHFANGWVFEPAIVGPDIVDYTVKEGSHAGRDAIQHFYFQRVAPGVETTVVRGKWRARPYSLVFRDTTVHRFAALPAWLAEDMTVTTKTPRSSRKSESLFRSGRIGPGTSSTMTAISR